MVLVNGQRWGVLVTVAALSVASSSVSARKINLAEVFLKSNIAQCVELQFEGFAVFTKVTPSFLTGVSVRVIASPITSHYNPDFTVSAYPRLGTSPSLESYVVFGGVQNALSAPMVELLSGFDVPASYEDHDQWGAPGSEAQQDKTKSILRYYETEVLGHPGNLYTAVSRGMNGEVPIDIDNIGDVITEIPRQLSTLPAVLASSVQQLANGVTTLGAGFPDLHGEDFNPVAWGQTLFSDNLADLYRQLPTDALDSINEIAGSAEAEVASVITGAIDKAQNSDLGQEISAAIDGSTNECEPTAETSCDESATALTNLDVSGLPDAIAVAVKSYFWDLTPEDILEFLAPGMSEQLDEVLSLVETYENFSSMISSSGDSAGGLGARFEPWKGLCPSDTSPMVPYFLSGMNVPGWRFKIPELVYPQTYVPFSNETTIGNFSPVAALGLTSDPPGAQHNYGSVYPRNGYMMQPDSVKAGAVAAFRAAHIVTRPGQPYLYTNAVPLKNDDEFYMFHSRYEGFDATSARRGNTSMYLHPHLAESGRWQLIHSENATLDDSCQLFGDASVNPEIPLVDASNVMNYLREGSPAGSLLPDNEMPRQWSEGKQSDDHQYVFNLWRRYRCAPDPDESGAWTTHSFNVILPTITMIE